MIGYKAFLGHLFFVVGFAVISILAFRAWYKRRTVLPGVRAMGLGVVFVVILVQFSSNGMLYLELTNLSADVVSAIRIDDREITDRETISQVVDALNRAEWFIH